MIDASVWVAINHIADPSHTRCVAWLDAALAAKDRLLAPTLLPTEVAGAIRRLTRQQAPASGVVDRLFEVGVVELIGLDHARSRRAAGLAAATGMRGADSVYLALAQELEEVLVTIDRRQADVASGIVEVRMP